MPRASDNPSAHKFLLSMMAETVHEAMDEYGVDAGNRGLLEALEDRSVGTDPGMAQPVMEDARKIKTEDDIECLQQVAAIFEAGFQWIKDAARLGMRENEVWGEAVQELWRHG